MITDEPYRKAGLLSTVADIEQVRSCGYEFHLNSSGNLRWTKARTASKAERRIMCQVIETMDHKEAVRVLMLDQRLKMGISG